MEEKIYTITELSNVLGISESGSTNFSRIKRNYGHSYSWFNTEKRIRVDREIRD